MASVWAVTSGEYSDYGVTCICATEAIANEVAAKLNTDPDGKPRNLWSDYSVEEFPFLESADECIRVRHYFVQMNKDGEVVNTHTYDQDRFEPIEVETGTDDWFTAPGQDIRKVTSAQPVVRGWSTRSMAAAEQAARDRLFARLSAL